MTRGDRTIEHVLRRLAFGASTQDLARYAGWGPSQIIESLLNYEQESEDVDANMETVRLLRSQLRTKSRLRVI